METSSRHKDRIQREFTKQSVAYAGNPQVADAERIGRLVAAVAPSPDARVLDVATGPGYVALGFAGCCREVIGIDLTDAPLALAEEKRRERGVTNVRFERGDAENMSFEDSEFDVVVCRYLLHHVEDVPRVLAEMARVCRRHGTVAVQDMIASEDVTRAAYVNRFENLRDPSHLRAYPLSELLRLFGQCGLEVERVTTEDVAQSVERWLVNAQTPTDRAAEARRLIERDAADDLSGARPVWQDGALSFVQHIATIVGRRWRV